MVTKEIHVSRAVNLAGNGHVDAVAIVIDGTNIRALVGSGDWQKEAWTVYNEEAKRIVDALAISLPGGTMDRVIGLLLERRASLLVVPLFPTKDL